MDHYGQYTDTDTDITCSDTDTDVHNHRHRQTMNNYVILYPSVNSESHLYYYNIKIFRSGASL